MPEADTLYPIAGKKVSKPILKRDTVKTLFTPTLGDAQAETLIEGTLKFVDTWTPPDSFDGANWSTGFALTAKDWPGRRKAGTGFCE